MARITAPNRQYTGISASVPFAGGVGYTDSPRLVSWFRSHGYEVEEAPAQQGEERNGRARRG